VAGRFPFEKYDARDWIPLGGTSRNYRNVFTGDIISRRQFKQHYAPSIKSIEPLALPARGRTSTRKLTPTQREVELGRRRVEVKQKTAKKKIARIQKHKPRSSHSFALRSFKKKHQSKIFEVNPDVDEINTIRLQALRSGNISSYIVGILLIDGDTGAERSISLFSARYIRDAFTEADLEHGEDAIENLHVSQKSGSLTAVAWWMRVFLKRAAAIKHGIKFPEQSLMRRK